MRRTGSTAGPVLCRERLRGERNGSRSAECLRESREHHEVGVESHSLNATNAKRGEAVVVLQPAELALHGGAATVEALPLVGAVGDCGERDGAPLRYSPIPPSTER